MSLIKIQIFTEGEREKIRQAALKVLEEGRVKIEDVSIIKELAKRGAKVFESSETVSLPHGLVEEALETVGKRPILYTVEGKELHLYGSNRYYGTLSVDPFVLDYEHGLRGPVVNDVACHARLGDSLPKVDVIYKMDQGCTDAPRILSDLKTLEAFISNTTTAYSCATASLDSAIGMGPKGDFLTAPSTMELLCTREHFFRPDFICCQAGMDKGTLLENLHKRVEELVHSNQPSVPPDRLEEAQKFLAEEAKKTTM